MYNQTDFIEKSISHDEQSISFQNRIDNDEKIESEDWMPEAYRKTLIRQISQHAHSEIVGMLPERNWLTRAPSLHRKAILLAKIQDEAGHGLYLYSVAETLGGVREKLVDSLLAGKAKYSSIFNYPSLTWADIGAIGWLVDGAAIINQVSLCNTSYSPYARAMVKICKEESFHQRQGYDILWKLAYGSKEQKKMAQDAINRWWWPSLMMFGPHDKESIHGEQSMKWKIKNDSNDALRQKFLDQTVPQLEKLNLVSPDKDLRWNKEKGRYESGPINWEEFYNVIKGKGPCNQQRIQARKQVRDKHVWLREAVSCYKKRNNKKSSI